jgi:hypothetical protein
MCLGTYSIALIYIDRIDEKRAQNVTEIWYEAQRKILLCAFYYI